MGACGCRERDQEKEKKESVPATPRPPSPAQSRQVIEFEPQTHHKNSTHPSKVTSGTSFSRQQTILRPPKIITNQFDRSKTHLNARVPTNIKEKALTEPFGDLYKRQGGVISKSQGVQVYHAEYVLTGKVYLIRQLTKLGLIKVKHANKEKVKIAEEWRAVTHPNLVPVVDIVYDHENHYVICEVMTVQTLADLHSPLTESQAAHVLFQVLSVLMTAQRLHLAINPLSILILNLEKWVVKVKTPIDIDESGMHSFRNIKVFTSPEKEKTEKSDIWSCGVVLHYLLSLDLPYTTETYRELQSHPQELHLSVQLNRTSEEVRSLLRRMLARSVDERPTIAQCLSDPWFVSHHQSTDIKSLNEGTRSFRSGHKITPLKAAVLRFMITKVMQGTDLAAHVETFNALDRDGNGVVTEEELRMGLARLMPKEKAMKESRKIMAAVQLDADNTINYHEYLISAVDEKSLFTPNNLSKAFAYIDTDGSGTISAEELKSCLFGDTGDSEVMWREMSKSATLLDGKVTFSEFSRMLTYS